MSTSECSKAKGSRGTPVARAELLEKVWRIDFDTGTNIVDVDVARLRAKLTALEATCRIDAERGVGYKFTEARPETH